jgi:hypothetical protein
VMRDHAREVIGDARLHLGVAMPIDEPDRAAAWFREKDEPVTQPTAEDELLYPPLDEYADDPVGP